MPQMSPMMWLLISILFFIYMNMLFSSFSMKTKMLSTKKSKLMSTKWKW